MNQMTAYGARATADPCVHCVLLPARALSLLCLPGRERERDADQNAAPWNITEPRVQVLRRDTHLSIARIAASPRSLQAEARQQMIDVPWCGST